MIKRILLSVLLFAASFATAQDTATLTGTVTDSDSQTWNNAVVTFNLNNPSGQTPVDCQSGTRIPPQVKITLSGAGVFSGTIERNDKICPAGTSWTPTIQPIASVPPTTTPTQNIAASTFNAATVINANILAPRFSASIPGQLGYNTTEVVNPSYGSQFFNVILVGQEYYNVATATWFLGASSGTITGAFTPGYYPIATGTNILGNGTIDQDITDPTGMSIISHNGIYVTANGGPSAGFEVQASIEDGATDDSLIYMESGTGFEVVQDATTVPGATNVIGFTNYDSVGGIEEQNNGSGAISRDQSGTGPIHDASNDYINDFSNTYNLRLGGTPELDYNVSNPNLWTFKHGVVFGSGFQLPATTSGGNVIVQGAPFITGYTLVLPPNNPVQTSVLVCTGANPSICNWSNEGTVALATNSIASGACQTVTAGSVNSTAATGATTANTLTWTPVGSIQAVTGYQVSTSGALSIDGYITSGFVNFNVCNWTLNPITPGALTLKWTLLP